TRPLTEAEDLAAAVTHADATTVTGYARPSTLEAAARRYAESAYAETIRDPKAYGIDEPWNSIQEWIDFELAGDAEDEVRRWCREFQVDYQTASAVLVAQCRALADLKALNAPFNREENE